MEDIQYIMITNWELHWDKLGPRWNHSTLYTIPMIKDGIGSSPWPSEAVTLFIKKSKTNEFEKCWIGKSKDFRPDPNNGNPAIRFEVADLTEIDCPIPYKLYSPGWYLVKSGISIPTPASGIVQANEEFAPPFFKEMATCNATIFELHCYHLLRLLGIHTIHKIPATKSAGKEDGFFRFQTLSVIYDATLNTNFKEDKDRQVENYISRLKKEKVEYDNTVYTIKDTQRQVWIITRGTNVNLLRTEDSIKVKEIPYTRLIEIYHQRLNESIDLDGLWDILKDLN